MKKKILPKNRQKFLFIRIVATCVLKKLTTNKNNNNLTIEDIEFLRKFTKGGFSDMHLGVTFPYMIDAR